MTTPSLPLDSSVDDVLAAINGAIIELRDAVIDGTYVGRKRSDLFCWMHGFINQPNCVSIRSLIIPLRLRLAIEVSVSFYRSWRNREQGIDADTIDRWPFGELLLPTSIPRQEEIIQRWQIAGGPLVGTDRRLIVLKSSPVWEAFSLFNIPYPPFDSVMDTNLSDIRRDEACSLSLMTDMEQFELPLHFPEPAALAFESDELSAFVDGYNIRMSQFPSRHRQLTS